MSRTENRYFQPGDIDVIHDYLSNTLGNTPLNQALYSDVPCDQALALARQTTHLLQLHETHPGTTVSLIAALTANFPAGLDVWRYKLYHALKSGEPVSLHPAYISIYDDRETHTNGKLWGLIQEKQNHSPS